MTDPLNTSQINTLTVVTKEDLSAKLLLHKDSTYHYQWNKARQTPTRSTKDFEVIVGAFALGSGVRFSRGGSNPLLVGRTMKHVYVNGIDIKDQYLMKRTTDIEPSEDELRSYGQKVLTAVNGPTGYDEIINALPPLEASTNIDKPVVEPSDDLDFEQSPLTLEDTTIETVVEERRGQQEFRRRQDILWGGKCAVTGCSVRQVLRASHAIPWAECKTGAERIDPYNGFLLNANLDALFDAFLITFDMNGQIRISSKLSTKDCTLLGISKDMKLRFIKEAHHPYLSFHQARFEAQES